MRVIIAVALSSAVIFTPALAAAQATSTGTAATVTAPAGTVMSDSSGVNLDEVVCKNSPPPTGSRLGGGRECHSQREWNQRQIDSQKALTDAQRLGYTSKGG